MSKIWCRKTLTSTWRQPIRLMYHRNILTRRKGSISIIRSIAITSQMLWPNNIAKDLPKLNKRPPNKRQMLSNKSLRIQLKILMIMMNPMELNRRLSNQNRVTKKKKKLVRNTRPQGSNKKKAKMKMARFLLPEATMQLES